MVGLVIENFIVVIVVDDDGIVGIGGVVDVVCASSEGNYCELSMLCGVRNNLSKHLFVSFFFIFESRLRACESVTTMLQSD